MKTQISAPVLIALAVFLGMLPKLLSLFGYRSFEIGMTTFILNLGLCAVGALTTRYRLFWICWGIASVTTFVFLSMATPIGAIFVLPILYRIILPA